MIDTLRGQRAIKSVLPGYQPSPAVTAAVAAMLKERRLTDEQLNRRADAEPVGRTGEHG